MKKLTHFVTKSVCFLFFVTLNSNAADREWITTNYGAPDAPLSWFDANNWSPNSVPVDGQSARQANPCCTLGPYTSIDNGGNGVSLPSSDVAFSTKTYLLDSSAGDLSDIPGNSYDLGSVDDVFEAHTIEFNGEGGGRVEVYVPVIADTFTSDKHGASFYAPITVRQIIANSAHQDRWEINVSPTQRISRIELNERRGADGGSIDGYFAVNADTQVYRLQQVWQELRVGSGASLLANIVEYYDYSNNGDTNNNINPIRLDGSLTTSRFVVIDVSNGDKTLLPVGTYGRIGNGSVDFEVDWITSGDGVLNVFEPDDDCFVISDASFCI